MRIIADCPRCRHEFMYDSVRDHRLISEKQAICQHCYDKQNESVKPVGWHNAKKVLIDGFWYVRAADVKIS